MDTTQQFRLSIPELRAELFSPVIEPGDVGYDAARRVFLPAVDRSKHIGVHRPRVSQTQGAGSPQLQAREGSSRADSLRRAASPE